VASRLRGVSIDLVVSSPFKRCLQTAAEIVAQLGLPQGRWLVDWGLSEVGGRGRAEGLVWARRGSAAPLAEACTGRQPLALTDARALLQLIARPPPNRRPQICDPRVLLHGRPDCEHTAKGRPLDAWMWGGASLGEALDMFAQSCEPARAPEGVGRKGLLRAWGGRVY
jgi:hypothetical protein